ncbi:hypothetical protein E2C01_003994 [Portunus trituberculatus]|uniref:Uncharacterized protein n=1 Tax=Portunus trituberculatus TaxID=210409 RepID=A0A5B7CNQ5_PORTR|nr:hypothetical protein [Portunus trituberculatus]
MKKLILSCYSFSTYFQTVHFLVTGPGVYGTNTYAITTAREGREQLTAGWRVVVLVARRQEPGDWRWQDPSPSRLWSATHPPLRLTPPSPIDPATPMVENPGCWPATLTRRDTPRHLTHDRPITFLGHAHASDNQRYVLYWSVQTTKHERKSSDRRKKKPYKRTLS